LFVCQYIFSAEVFWKVESRSFMSSSLPLFQKAYKIIEK